jgi:uncharacterized protein (TIGR03437 family)
VRIANVAPGLFAAGEYAAANVVAARGGTQTVTNVLDGPIDLGPEDQQTVLVLYGTGIRNHRDPVTASIGAQTITANYAGAQGTFAGEDQINVPLPRSLAGAGIVNVTLNVDGQSTNVVKIQIR